METVSNENTLQSVDEHHPVDQQHPFEQQHPVEQEHPVNQQHLVDQERSVDEARSADQEHSVDQEQLVDHHQDNMVADVLNHGVSETEPDFNEEEVRRTLEVIASTGKFCVDCVCLQHNCLPSNPIIWGQERFKLLSIISASQ